jgi:hypothetical protein
MSASPCCFCGKHGNPHGLGEVLNAEPPYRSNSTGCE